MKHVLRPFLLIAVLCAAAVGLVACGGDDEGSGGAGKSVGSDTDVAQVLDRAFSGQAKIDSGVVTVKLDGKGSKPDESGQMELSGPFEVQGKDKLPKVALKLTASGGGQSIDAGFTNTGSKAFVSFRGTDYALEDQLYQQVVKAVAEASKQSGAESGKSIQEQFGVDPKNWLSNPQNAGDSDVGGEETVKVTGDANLDTILKDFNTIAKKSASLAGGGANVPQEITPEQMDQVKSALKQAKVEVDAAKSDGGVRRMAVDFEVEEKGEGVTGVVEITLTDVNKPQEFPEPANPKPIQELISSLGGLGGLFGGTTPGSGGTKPGATTPPSADQEKLAKCIEAAGSDQQKAAECLQQASG